MSFRKRLLDILHKYELKPVDLSRELGYASAEKISRLVRDEANKPSYQLIGDIIKAFPEINARWLATGEGEMVSDPKSSYGFCAECVKKDAVIEYQEKKIEKLNRTIEELQNKLNDRKD